MAEIQIKFLNAGNKYCFAFEDEEELKRELKRENWDDHIAPDPVTHISQLFQMLYADVQMERYDRIRDTDQLLNLQSELKAISSEYQRKIRKCIAKDKVDKFSFQPHYIDTLKFMSSKKCFSKTPPYVLRKFAYLSAAFAAFFMRCLPDNNYRWVMNKLDRALARTADQQTPVWDATAVMEEYIAGVILKSQCARIRGAESEREDIRTWYDPRDKCFLLRSKLYFAEVQPLIPDGTISQRAFEQRLVDEGTLQTVVRGKQARRTFEIKVSPRVGKDAFIKVNSQKFAGILLSNPKITQRLQAMNSDPSPYRELSN